MYKIYKKIILAFQLLLFLVFLEYFQNFNITSWQKETYCSKTILN